MMPTLTETEERESLRNPRAPANGGRWGISPNPYWRCPPPCTHRSCGCSRHCDSPCSQRAYPDKLPRIHSRIVVRRVAERRRMPPAPLMATFPLATPPGLTKMPKTLFAETQPRTMSPTIAAPEVFNFATLSITVPSPTTMPGPPWFMDVSRVGDFECFDSKSVAIESRNHILIRTDKDPVNCPVLLTICF